MGIGAAGVDLVALAAGSVLEFSPDIGFPESARPGVGRAELERQLQPVQEVPRFLLSLPHSFSHCLVLIVLCQRLSELDKLLGAQQEQLKTVNQTLLEVKTKHGEASNLQSFSPLSAVSAFSP